MNKILQVAAVLLCASSVVACAHTSSNTSAPASAPTTMGANGAPANERQPVSGRTGSSPGSQPTGPASQGGSYGTP